MSSTSGSAHHTDALEAITTTGESVPAALARPAVIVHVLDVVVGVLPVLGLLIGLIGLITIGCGPPS